MIVVFGAALLASLPAQPAFAQGTPRIAEPGTGTISFTYANQNAREFWRPVDGSIMKVKGPLGDTDANLAQNTMGFAANYAVNDFVALTSSRPLHPASSRGESVQESVLPAGRRATAACSTPMSP